MKENVIDLIKKRRTIRKFKKRTVSVRQIKRIIEAGTWAPSAHNTQPWNFIVIKDNKKRDALIKIMRRTSAKLLTGARVQYNGTINVIQNAPVILLVYNSNEIYNRIKRLGEPYCSIAKISEIQSISAAIQNMCLAAAYYRVGMTWLTMPLYSKTQISKYIREKKELMAVLALGYGNESGKSLPRRKISDVMRFI